MSQNLFQMKKTAKYWIFIDNKISKTKQNTEYSLIIKYLKLMFDSDWFQVRQLAAVLLRRKVQKGRQWRALPENVCQKYVM